MTFNKRPLILPVACIAFCLLAALACLHLRGDGDMALEFMFGLTGGLFLSILIMEVCSQINAHYAALDKGPG